MSILARIANEAVNRPLLIMPEKLAVIMSVLQGRIGLEAADPASFLAARSDPALLEAMRASARTAPDASRFAGSRADKNDDGRTVDWLPYARTADGVAILTITGTLVNRGAWVGASSGLTSYEGVKYQAERIAADPKVKSVILDIESPGGAATGAFEAAAAIRALDAVKPVTAVINGMAASAAYAIASGARRIVSTPTGVSGSIGVVLLHMDYSGLLSKEGVKPTLIHAGAHKVDGNPYEALSKDVQSDLQAEVDRFYDLFVETVAIGRKTLDATKIRDTEARTFLGAEAKGLGLADDVGSFEDVLADLSTAAKSRLPTAQRRNAMSDNSNGPVFAQADLDNARNEGHRAGVAEGTTAGAAVERARIGAILGGEHAKGREPLAQHFAFATDMTPEAAAAALQAAPAAAAVPTIAERAAETTSLRRAEGGKSEDAPKQAGAAPIASIVDQVNAEAARAAGKR